MNRVAEFALAGRGGEHDVAVQGREDGIDRARESRRSHDGKALRLRLGECHVGCDHGEGGVFSSAALEVWDVCIRGKLRRPAEAAELVTLLERCGPEVL